MLMLAGLEEKDLEQKLSSEAATYVMLAFLKEKKVSNLFYPRNLNANSLYSSMFTIQTLKQLFLATLPKKRKRKWQLKRETRRIGALDLVKSLVVLDFTICTRESKANLQWKRYGWEVAIQTFNALRCARISWN